MKAFKEFRREDKSFWFFIRFISEKLGVVDLINYQNTDLLACL